MLKCCVAPAAMLAYLFFSQAAYAFFDPPSISPQPPQAGEPIFVSIHGGGCDAIAERAGFPQITQVGNAIRILEYGHHWEFPDLCIYEPATVTHQIGTFPPGEYTLTVDFTYNDFLPAPVVVTLGGISFTISGQAPAASAVPVTTSLGSGILVVFIASLALLFLRSRSSVILLLAALCTPIVARASDVEEICIVPTTAVGAPTPTQIMTWINSAPRSGTPPLSAFSIVAPQSSYWLIADRASGDFLTWLNNNPNSARRRLEDCQLATFFAADIPAALAALQADPYVASASIAPPTSPPPDFE